jgi:hypothetical protein
LDFVGFQETKKVDMPDATLRSISNNMVLNVVPADGAAGGMLIGFKNQMFDFRSWQYFKYCAVSIIKGLADNKIWRLVVVYGSPYEEGKIDFINEINMIMERR